MSDYGKIAYDELQDLKKRVEILENSSKSTKFSELRFSAKDEEVKSSHRKQFQFCVLSDGTLNFNVSGKISGTSSRAQVVVYLDGVKIRNVYVSSNEFSFVCQSAASKGTSTLEIQLLYYTAFGVEELNVSFCGAVEYVEVETQLEVLNQSTKSIVVFRCDDEAVVMEYSAKNLAKKLTFQGVMSAAVSGFSGKVMIAVVQKDKTLKFRRIGDNFETIAEFECDGGVSQVSGGKSKDGFLFYAINGSRIYRFVVGEDNSVLKSDLSLSAAEVVSSPNVENVIISKDFSGNMKFVALD